MAETVYRFLPWTRRGLAAALPDDAGDGASLPARPEIAVKVVVAGAGEALTSARLHGPGDVVGIDPQQVVRTYPRAWTTDAEPNYLAAVDLDAPELPWLFTPRGVPAGGHLPPWVVLVVVENRPGVSVTVPVGASLPRLTIESGAAAELPDLADSWAWAHVQLVEPGGGAATTGQVATTLAAEPDRNVARLVCPRRLAPRRRWIAALVPAFDAGRVRGLGGAPAAGAPVGPAWTPGQDAVTLPVYFHWEFQTGVEGDFESLTQRLKPHKAATTVGLVRMHVGAAAPPLAVPAGEDRLMDMDGALRAPAQSDGRLADVPAALRIGLKEVTRTLADAADGVLDGQTLEDGSRQPVGPPVYASSHVRRWHVLDQQDGQDAEWFRELNLDPRARVAAGLGAECVRENQEDIAHAAWRQVGDVLAAEAALQRAALSTLVSTSFYRRTVALLQDDRLLALAGPLAARAPVDGRSLKAGVAVTSLPDAVLDAGLRRALSPASRAIARSARRIGVAATDVRTGLVPSLAKGRADLDATRFSRPALSGVGAGELTGSTLTGLGLDVEVGRDVVKRLRADATSLDERRVALEERFVVRDEVRTVGLVGQAHVEAARMLATTVADTIAAAGAAGAEIAMATTSAVASAAVLDGVVEQATLAVAATPSGGTGVGLLVQGPVLAPDGASLVKRQPTLRVDVLDVDAGRTLVVRTEGGRANVPIAVLDADLAGADLVGVLSRLPAGVLTPGPAGGHVDRALLPTIAAGGPQHHLTGSAFTGTRGGLSPAFRAPEAGPALPPGAVGAQVRGLDAARPELRRTVRPGVQARPGIGAGLEPVAGTGLGPVVGRHPVGPVVGPVVVPEPVVSPVVRPVGGTVGGTAPSDHGRATAVVPPLIREPQTIARFESALAAQRDTTVLMTAAPTATVVPYDLAGATASLRLHVDPAIAQPLRRDATLAFAGVSIGVLRERAISVDGWWATRALDRVMAYPTFPVAASDYLAAYDRSRFCPGVDTIPPDSVTLLETNPRFIASFMAGLNHETNRELLWRGFPTDSRGTPFRRFWRRLDGKDDIPPIHGWRLGTLAEQTPDPKGNLVLLVRGDLLRRYPDTVVLALPALGPREPDHDRALKPIFRGAFDPDVSFFGFPLVDADLERGEGWFFALMEPVSEPRFGLDETKGGPTGGGAASASDALAWPDTGVPEGGHLGRAAFGSLGLNPFAAGADDVAATLFARPFALYVHAKHLVHPLPVQQ